MATSDALVKYYDCLRDSFNKIQDKANQTALENAALRPKIREEFIKSREVLNSYLNYIQIFSVVYSEKFSTICSNIIVPLFKEDEIKKESNTDKNLDYIDKIHQTLKAIINSKQELAVDFVQSVIKVFPNLPDKKEEKNETFICYLKNCLKICTYIEGGPLGILIAKILERLNPPPSDEATKADEVMNTRNILEESYGIIFEHLRELEGPQLERISNTLINTFTNEYLSSKNEPQLNYILLYICSRDSKSTELLLTCLWSIFSDSTRSTKERKASLMFASAFIARANYLDLDKVYEYLETANKWCREFLVSYKDNIHKHDEETSYNENIDSFYAIVQSMLYLITQRYREMYEEESITKLKELDLNYLIKSHLKPLQVCDAELESRFQEVAALYNIAQIQPDSINGSATKRRKSDFGSKIKTPWIVPYEETGKSVPEDMREIYRCYVSHRIFTVFRE